MQDYFSLKPNTDGSFDIFLYYGRVPDSEFSMDMVYDKTEHSKAALAKKLHDHIDGVRVAQVHVMVGQIEVASFPYSRIASI